MAHPVYEIGKHWITTKKMQSKIDEAVLQIDRENINLENICIILVIFQCFSIII